MRFPTPEVAGVFLKLPGRVESAITDGAAAHYLHGHPPGSASPKRLRNNLGFHGAVAEFVDALLERAVLPYQTTDMLPSLTMLPDADFRHKPGSAAPHVFCPVELGSAIAYAKNRAKLGHEKRFAPLEFWRDMIRGSDALARHMEPAVLPPPPDDGSSDGGSSDGGSSDDGYDAIVYPSVLYPRALMLPQLGQEGKEAPCGFYDLCDTGWEPTADYPRAWLPAKTPFWDPDRDLSYLGRTALEVFSMLEFPSSWRDKCSMPMVAGLAGLDGALPWPWMPSSLYVHEGVRFAGYGAAYRRWDWERYPQGWQRWWPSNGGPYLFDFVDDVLAVGQYALYPPPEGDRIVAKACFEAAALAQFDHLYSVDDLRTSWISPYDWHDEHAFIKPTARPNLDILRIQQVLLGSMWANWAKIPVETTVPHRLTTTKYNYVVHMDGAVDLVDSTTTETYPREVNKAVWSHGASCDSGGGQGGSVCRVSFPFDLCKLRKSYSDVVDEYEPPEGLEEARQEMAVAESVLALDFIELVDRMTLYNFAGDMADTNSDQLRVEMYVNGDRFVGEAFPYTPTSTVSEIAGQMMAAAKALAADHPGAGSFSTFRHIPAGDSWSPDWYNISGDWFTPAMWQHLADYGEAKRVLDPLEAADCGIAVDVSDELFKALKKAVDNGTAVYEFCDAPEGDDGSSGSSDDVTVPFSVTTWWRRPYGPAIIEFAERHSDSPWPAASVVEGGYVNAETLALGLTAEDTIEGWVDKPADRTYERRRVDGSGEIVYPTHTICRRIAMRNNNSPQVSVSTPAAVLAQLVADLTQNAQPETEISDPLLAARFLPFSMLSPYPHGVAGTYETDPGWSFPPMFAWYHPDKSPWASGCSDDGSDDGSSGAGLEVFPYRITATDVCGAEVEIYWASPEEAYINRLSVEGWMTFTYPYGDAPTCDESFTLDLSDHIALRAVWNWKSMPVEQE